MRSHVFNQFFEPEYLHYGLSNFHQSPIIISYPDHLTHLPSAHVQTRLPPGLTFPPRSYAGININIQLQVLIKFLTSCIASIDYIHKNTSILAHGIPCYHHYHIEVPPSKCQSSVSFSYRLKHQSTLEQAKRIVSASTTLSSL